MKSDAFFVKGQSHDICQDYAIARPNVIAISDGCSLINKDGICSKHPNSDIAARLICLSVTNKSDMPSLKGLRDVLNVEMDATLTSVVYDNSVTEILRIGDGVIFLEFLNGTKNIITLKFEPNTPAYVSYYLSEKSKERYITENISAIETLYQIADDWSVIKIESGECRQASTLQLGSYQLPKSDGIKSVSIFSDGILDIQGPNGRLDIVDAVKALVTFKRTNGEFVLARMKAQLRDWVREGIFPNDDLSMATLILE